jgi:hypothetical protein
MKASHVADFAGAVRSRQLGVECGQCVPGIECHAREGSEDVEVEASARIDGLHCRDDRPQQMCARPFHLGVGVVAGGSCATRGPNEYIMLDDITPFMKSIASFLFRFGATLV